METLFKAEKILKGNEEETQGEILDHYKRIRSCIKKEK